MQPRNGQPRPIEHQRQFILVNIRLRNGFEHVIIYISAEHFTSEMFRDPIQLYMQTVNVTLYKSHASFRENIY